MLATITGAAMALLGSVVSVLLSHRSERAIRADTRTAQRHTDQIDAVTTLAAAISDHRRSMWVAGDAILKGASERRFAEVQEECHRTRSAITAPAVRIRLLIRDHAVREAAATAIQATYAIRDAAAPAELEKLRRFALDTHDILIERAAEYLS